MSLFKRLFGGGDGGAPKAEPELYKDYLIFAEPISEGATYRIAARIEKEVGDTLKTCSMIRADTFNDEGMAVEATIAKAKQFIDQVGDGIFE